MGILSLKNRLPQQHEVLPGRDTPMSLPNQHAVHGRPLADAFRGLAIIEFGMGCFWGAERLFWQMSGVFTTAVGYAGGPTPHPTYQEVCTGLTGHAEVVRVVYDPTRVPLIELFRQFWENHDPTQGMRQGNDQGSQYRSMVLCQSAPDYAQALASRDHYQQALQTAGFGKITTEIYYPAPVFYYAEERHQQYLAKNPQGYCGLAGTNVACSISSLMSSSASQSSTCATEGQSRRIDRPKTR